MLVADMRMGIGQLASSLREDIDVDEHEVGVAVFEGGCGPLRVGNVRAFAIREDVDQVWCFLFRCVEHAEQPCRDFHGGAHHGGGFSGLKDGVEEGASEFDAGVLVLQPVLGQGRKLDGAHAVYVVVEVEDVQGAVCVQDVRDCGHSQEQLLDEA